MNVGTFRKPVKKTECSHKVLVCLTYIGTRRDVASLIRIKNQSGLTTINATTITKWEIVGEVPE